MYFPKRLRDWLLTCLAAPRASRDCIAFHLVELSDRFDLSLEHHRDASEVCIAPLEVPKQYAGDTLQDCVEALTVLFKGHLSSTETRYEHVLRNVTKIVLRTANQTIEVKTPEPSRE